MDTTDNVTFDEFKRIDLVIGRIVSVENHPNADKLYVMQVDLGSETRQVIAGLRPYYETDQLVGKSVVVVTNLQPAKLRGVDSNGMLLAAQDGDSVIILKPETDVSPGSHVL